MEMTWGVIGLLMLPTFVLLTFPLWAAVLERFQDSPEKSERELELERARLEHVTRQRPLRVRGLDHGDHNSRPQHDQMGGGSDMGSGI